MRVTTHATLAAALLLSAASAFAFNLGDAAKAVAGASQGDSAQVATTPQTMGMDSGMTEKFAQVLVDYFGKQGANSELLGSLSNLWGVSKAGGSSLL